MPIFAYPPHLTTRFRSNNLVWFYNLGTPAIVTVNTDFLTTNGAQIFEGRCDFPDLSLRGR